MPTTRIEADHDYYATLANRFFALCDMYLDDPCIHDYATSDMRNEYATSYACCVLYTELGVHEDEVMYAISYAWLNNYSL